VNSVKGLMAVFRGVSDLRWYWKGFLTYLFHDIVRRGLPMSERGHVDLRW
jgi:hypothetical protein